MILTVVLAGMHAGPGHAIHKEHDGTGAYVIVPFVIANEDYDTLVLIDTGTTAVKVRILDQHGQPMVTGNLYSRATWTASLSREDDKTVLASNSEECLIVEEDGEYVATQILEFDLEYGSIEFVTMGTRLPGHPFDFTWRQRDCETIASLWNDPSWADDANSVLSVSRSRAMQASTSIINVTQGTMYSVDATALNEFSNIVQHTAPDNPRPDLRDTHDEGTPAGETTSTVCMHGECISDTWENPLDASSAALMVTSGRTDFIIADHINAKTEWIVNFPTARFYPDENPLSMIEARLVAFDRSGDFVGIGPPIGVPPQVDFFDWTYMFELNQAVSTFDFNRNHQSPEESIPSSIFGIEHTLQNFWINRPDLVFPDHGTAILGFESGGGDLVTDAERYYQGRPAIVVSFQEYSNGTLTDEDGNQVRANYGKGYSPVQPSHVWVPPDLP